MNACRSIVPISLAAAMLIIAGCGRGAGRLPIEGAVTVDGQPLEAGYIVFFPEGPGGGPSAGAEVVDGRYRIGAAGGAFAGTFRVEITASRKTDALVYDEFSGQQVAEYRQFLPARYNTQTELRAEVTPGGPNRFDFELNLP